MVSECNFKFINFIFHAVRIEAKTFLDLMSYIFSLIDMCNDKNVQYCDQSLIVVESAATTDDPKEAEDTASMLCPGFFQKIRFQG